MVNELRRLGRSWIEDAANVHVIHELFLEERRIVGAGPEDGTRRYRGLGGVGLQRALNRRAWFRTSS